MTSHNSSTDLACHMSALTPEQRRSHSANSQRLFASVHAVHSLPDGYTFKLNATPEVLFQTADFISCERLCCPFFTFQVTVEAEGGTLWLSLTGPEGVKALIAREIGGHLRETVAQAAGLGA